MYSPITPIEMSWIPLSRKSSNTMLVKPALEGKKLEATAEQLSQSTSVSGAKFEKTIKVAGDPWSGYSTFRSEPRLAAALAKSKIGVDYVDDEALYEQGARMEALAGGQIDVALTTIDAFLQHGAVAGTE